MPHSSPLLYFFFALVVLLLRVGFCIPFASAAPLLTCQDEPLNKMPFCNISLPVTQRVDDLLSRLSMEQVCQQLGNNVPAIPELGVPAYDWWSECLHGVLSKCGTNCPTSFPAPCALGASFDMPLIHKMARAISDEARALHNEGVTGLDFWAPNINIGRDPRWGRNMEVPGEDPYLTAQYVMNFMKGLQEGEDPRYPKVVGTCKHYAAYSLENWGGNERNSFNAVVSDYDLVNTFLPQFKSCIVEGGARSIMCSYNAVNGVPACGNDFLLQTILRDTWNFQGYVVSDCDAVSDIFVNHKYTSTPEDTCQVALKAGTDLNCGSFYQDHLYDTYKEGKLTEEEIKTSMKRLLQQRFELGMWDPPELQPYTRIPPSVVDSPEHSQLALQAARESIVLLKNDGLLPLSIGIKRVAVIGPNANITKTLLGNYFGQRCHDDTFDCVTTPYHAIKAKLPNSQVIYAPGCDINSNDKSRIPDAVKLASASDVAIVLLGLNLSVEDEGVDRQEIGLPGVQEDLIKAIVATRVPTVVVMIHGGAVAIEWIKDNVPAIVDAFYPGENGGPAIADVLFGDYNPGGRLPFTVFPKEYVNISPFTNMSLRAGGPNPGFTYRYYTGPLAPLWEFGFGLSYTTFQTEWIERPQPSVIKSFAAQASSIPFRIKVTNTGKRDGDEVVLAFVRRDNTSMGPLKQLFAFQRVHLKIGETKEVFFAVGPEALATAAEGLQKAIYPGTYYIEVGIGDKKLSHPLEVEGPLVTFRAF